jgi:hypothetical protein
MESGYTRGCVTKIGGMEYFGHEPRSSLVKGLELNVSTTKPQVHKTAHLQEMNSEIACPTPTKRLLNEIYVATFATTPLTTKCSVALTTILYFFSYFMDFYLFVACSFLLSRDRRHHIFTVHILVARCALRTVQYHVLKLDINEKNEKNQF